MCVTTGVVVVVRLQRRKKEKAPTPSTTRTSSVLYSNVPPPSTRSDHNDKVWSLRSGEEGADSFCDTHRVVFRLLSTVTVHLVDGNSM